MPKGKLIVFEGTDGSGKSTQFKFFIDWLRSKNIEFHQLRFPRYDEPSSILVRMYLGGKFGNDPEAISPYAASTFYAVDRYASFMQEWKTFYEEGGLLIADRYTTSNAVHQGGKVPASERKKFFEWLYDLEFNKMGLPKPDRVILMDMPIDICQRLLALREDITQIKKDIHELDIEYLKLCRQTSLEAAETYGWDIIHCNDESQPRSVKEISQEVQKIVAKEIGISLD